MRFRIKFNKKNYLKYISHLDLLRLFERIFIRMDLPLQYSKGFNPRPKISIASPLSLGMESEEEWMDIELVEETNKEDFIKNANAILPEDIRILGAEYVYKNIPIARLISWCLYTISFDLLEDVSEADLQMRLKEWSEREEILIERYRKKGRQKILVRENIAGLMKDISVEKPAYNKLALYASLKIGESGTLRPRDFVDALINDNGLKVDMDSINFKRTGQKI